MAGSSSPMSSKVCSFLQSDNSREFVTNIIIGICSSFGIEIRHGRPCHPMSQGQIERLNQTIGRGFTKMMWDENSQLQHVDWINHLPKFVFSYNNTIHSAHRKTPREVFFWLQTSRHLRYPSMSRQRGGRRPASRRRGGKRPASRRRGGRWPASCRRGGGR